MTHMNTLSGRGAFSRGAVALVAAFLLCATTTVHAAREWRFVPPEGTGVVNVKDYGAVGDGVADDTAAIVKAISENIDKSRYRSNPFFYFPDGTYKVTGPIESRVMAEGREQGKVWSAGWRSMMVLIGETRSGTVIKLADNAPGYTDASKPKWVIATGSEGDKRDNYAGGGNRAFRHGVLNLTVDVGQGNPGATAIDFCSSNRGTIDNVTVRAPQGSGHTGIDLTRWWPGPAMVMDVEIDGFDRGIALNHYQYGMTFENIRMKRQRGIGVANNQNVVTMRKVHFEGNVPFYKSGSGHNMLCLLDSTIIGTGTGEMAAIESSGMMNLRRVTVEGYGKVVRDTRKDGTDLPALADKATVVARHDQGFMLNVPGGAAVPLDLPIEDIPLVRPGASDKWVVAGETRAELQAQIDAGAEYICVKPLKAIPLDQPLILRGKLKLLWGMNGHIQAVGDNKVALRIEEGSSPVVVLEHMYVDGRIDHVSNRTFVLRHGDQHGEGYKATGKGKTHIVDVIGKDYDIGVGHTLWARQLNAEFGDRPLFVNAGTSWILGFKMESSTGGSKDAAQGTPSFLNRGGGKFELFGGLLYTLGSRKEHAPTVPAFTNERGRIAVSYRTNGIPATHYSRILHTGSGGPSVDAGQIKGNGAALLSDQR